MKVENYIISMVLWSLVMSYIWLVFYSFRPWRSTPQGQALWVKSLGNAILLSSMSLAYAWWGEYPLREAVRVVGFTVFAVGLTLLVGSLLFSEGASGYPPWSWLLRLRERLARHRGPSSRR